MTNTVSTGKAKGVATLMASALSNQLGAATGSLAFPVLGPVGVVAVRQLVAAAVLLPIVRPRLLELTWRQWWPVLLLAVSFGTMNLGLYASIQRIGLGLAVTLEFLGPLALAIISTRRIGSMVCALAAAAGVVAITQPKASMDWVGIALGLLAACSWAAYILLNRTVGRRIHGIQGTAAATGVSAVLFLPVAVVVFISQPVDVVSVLCAVGAGVLASVLPYVADLVALRRVPANLFGVLMSINPVFAAIIGAVLLRQELAAVQWVGIGLIVVSNAAVLLLGRPGQRALRPGQRALRPGQRAQRR
ncbi:EamA family transporter [Paenarthrobacter ilicis]|uniref:Inner membrane transporter RhtA n=1 Tax=Paenarthrobacter ilicis TaxID=43665 RepID=A0ABX0TID1_9MICC|nr:EamA family transporter [Paenarthrobacter ilicis]MBM7791750.1 inner membrane transporter RhtA [Paenarthrobacter ilicis]NIJ01625.1 inner membrane transporter RhtA [Paenarthrobacter ilicis]